MLNKSAQSNLGRGPRRVAHVRREVYVGYNAVPQISPQKYPFPWTEPKSHYLPHPWNRPIYDAERHPDLIRRFSTMHWTDRRTYGPTDRPRESLMTIAHYTSNETDAA